VVGVLKRHKAGLAAMLAAVALLAAVAIYFGIRERGAPGIGAAGRPAIAVMPFENSGGSEETRWLSQGLPNMLLTGLAQTPGLDVVSSQRLHEILKQIGEGKAETIEKSQVLEIARRAGAGAVVVGSIFQAGTEIRIDVQVQDVASGRLLFARSVQGQEVFPLIDELTEHIRESLDLAEAAGARGIAEVTSSSMEAYRLYTEGLVALNNFRNADARRLLERAVELDPDFAMAYFRLSQVVEFVGDPASAEEYRRSTMEHLDRLPERQKLLVQADQARRNNNPEETVELLEELIAKYPDEEEGYAGLGTVYAIANHLEKALETYARGVEALPNTGPLHNHYGYALVYAGRYAEGLRELETYVRLNPEEANPHDSLGEISLMTGQPERALEHYARALEIDPDFLSHWGRSWAFAMLGRYAEALEELEAQAKTFQKSGQPLTSNRFRRGFLLSRVGRYREASREIEQGIRLSQSLEDFSSQAAFEVLAALMAYERGSYSRVQESTRRAQEIVPKISAENPRRGAGVAAHLLGGVAEVRAGNPGAARRHLQSAKETYDNRDPAENWWYQALAGELALAENDLAAAEAAFSDGEAEFKMLFNNFFIIPSTFANNFPSRDWRARIRKQRGDLRGAVDVYRNLITPSLGSKWVSVLEPRYVLELARLYAQAGDTEAAKKEYQRFLALWKDADPDTPILREAKAEYAKLR
jgi:tetratricopeptide (TPR) repeat protein